VSICKLDIYLYKLLQTRVAREHVYVKLL